LSKINLEVVTLTSQKSPKATNEIPIPSGKIHPDPIEARLASTFLSAIPTKEQKIPPHRRGNTEK
jgi:hypothetical protein